jgi:hypothetical protein
MINESKEVLLSPKTAFPKMVNKANFWDGIQYLAIGFLIYSIFLYLLKPLITNQELKFINAIVGIFAGIIVGLIYTAIVWIFARLLGGKGKYDTQLRMMSIPLALQLLLNGILSLFLEVLRPSHRVHPSAGSDAIALLLDLIINILFILVFIISLLIGFYYVYLTVRAISEAHKISKLRAFAAWLIGIIILVMLLFLAIYLPVFGTYMSNMIPI